MLRSTQKHLPWILNILLDLDEESDCFPAIKETVIIRKGEVHHRSDLNLAVDGDRLVLDGVKTQYGGLWQIDNGSTHERSKDATIADGKSTASHVLDSKLVVACLE